MQNITKQHNGIDWLLVAIVTTIASWGLVTLYTFDTVDALLFDKQVLVLAIAGIAMLVLSYGNYRFLRHSWVVMGLYALVVGMLAALIAFGSVFSGAQSWFAIGGFALQPAEFAKVALILVLAKYFSKRHIEIASWRHLFVSGVYALVLFVLVARQPDFGSAVIIFLIWFGMVLLAGINWKQVALLLLSGTLALVMMWFFVFSPYQQQRIITYIQPTADTQGTGYNAAQAEIAVGSGGVWGKGVGYGSQSRLAFLPQYQTDFIVAAFAEEWGFVGMVCLLGLYLLVIVRLVQSGMHGETNFEMLFAGGVAIYLMAHVLVHMGINIGVLPVTGITTPFMSYGGSHLLAEAIALGLVFGMRRYRRSIHRQGAQSELYTHS